MNDAVLERALQDVFAASPSVARRTTVDAAIARARATNQRRPRVTLLDPAAWPAPRAISVARSPFLRIAVVVVLLAALLTAAVAGGWVQRWLPQVHQPFPLVEVLGQLDSRQVSATSGAQLADGRVLLVGGIDTTHGEQHLADAWLFDPVTRRLERTGSLNEARTSAIVVPLADGRALVFGGYRTNGQTGGNETVEGVELFDPRTGTFTSTAAPGSVRQHCPCGAGNYRPWAIPWATRLDDGRVFVTGGMGPSNSADLFDPRSERWTRLDVGCDASRGVQSLLAGGRVLVLCVLSSDNRNSPVTTRARIFDPASDSFSESGAPPAPARRAARLTDGRVLLVGFTSMLFDPATGQFKTLSLGDGLAGQPGFDIGRNRLLWLGGGQGAELSTFVFDGDRGALTKLDQPGFEWTDAVVPLVDGRLLTVGYKLESRLLDPTQLP